MITKKLLFVGTVIIATLIPTESYPKTLTIAVIDTGVDKHVARLCKYGHKSFIDSEPLKDNVGHGTHVASLIHQEVGNAGEYCMVSIKWYNPKAEAEINFMNMRKAIQYALNIGVDFMNISGGGTTPSVFERLIVWRALSKGVTIVAAAGNENSNLDSSCNYFPACYDNRIVTVGNRDGRVRQPSSNYGNYIKRWEPGTNAMAVMPDGTHAFMTGTSQATAIATGKLVRARLRK